MLRRHSKDTMLMYEEGIQVPGLNLFHDAPPHIMHMFDNLSSSKEDSQFLPLDPEMDPNVLNNHSKYTRSPIEKQELGYTERSVREDEDDPETIEEMEDFSYIETVADRLYTASEEVRGDIINVDDKRRSFIHGVIQSFDLTDGYRLNIPNYLRISEWAIGKIVPDYVIADHVDLLKQGHLFNSYGYNLLVMFNRYIKTLSF
ncbi:MAG: hypothetical protein ABJL43_09345 [Maribacter dokdonensis]|uniref:hypothetical protein n=1 Tax=Maribacter dokdonensis TaxID=320912 RepID=UPI003299017D